jgi:signal transduction histidine kinase
MKKTSFGGDLPPDTSQRVEKCDQRLTDPARLAALERTRLMDSPREEAFDRLAHLAARALKAPLTIISLVGADKQFFKAGFGLPPPYDQQREVPIDDSICRYTLAGETIIAADAQQDPLLKYHPTTKPWGIAAFIAIPMITRDGQVLGAFCAVDTKVRPWSEEDVHLLSELTASVMTEIELRERVQELELQRDFREQFVATLSHDLRTPLNVAKMGAQLLAEDVDPLERKRIVGMISDNMDRADQMIRDLLDISRIKAGESVPLEISECDLRGVAASTLESLASIHGQRFVLKSPDLLRGRWDEMALRRILENLVGNAVKYGSPETPITVELEESPREVWIRVHNLGKAIAPENLPALFEAFRRSESAAKSAQRGWGIGLTLVRGLAKEMGGDVGAASSPKAGTTFTVHLPRDARALRN